MSKILSHIAKKIEDIRDIHQELKKKKAQKDETPHIIPTEKASTKKQKVEIDIPITTIFKVIFVVALLFIAGELIVQLQGILTTAVICFFLAIGLTPILNGMEKRRIPRPLAILLLYILFLGALTILFVAIIPVVIKQIQPILLDLSEYFGSDFIPKNEMTELFSNVEALNIKSLLTSGDMTAVIEKVQGYFQSIVGTTFSILSTIFQGVFNVIFAAVLLFFILLEREQIGNTFLAFFPKKRQHFIRQKTARVQEKMAAWFRGQFILMIAVGAFMFIGMKIFEYTLGMQYAGAIALLAGFMEVFPYIGVFITGFFTVLIAYNVSWTLVVAVLIWMALTQFLEGNFLVPVVMEKVTGLSSVTVMLALSIGGILGNAAGGIPLAILGMIFAVPVAASIAIFLEQYMHREKPDERS